MGKISNKLKDQVIQAYLEDNDMDRLFQKFSNKSQNTIRSIVQCYEVKKYQENHVEEDQVEQVQTEDSVGRTPYIHIDTTNTEIMSVDDPNTILDVDYSSKLKCISGKYFVEAVLCNARHNIDVDKYIYDNIEGDKYEDYEWMDRTIAEFIDNNLTYNEEGGYYNQTLIVYLTGLSMPQASVAKVCFLKRVNLIFMHYNPKKSTYSKQLIYDCFGPMIPIEFTDILIKYRDVNSYGVDSYEDIINADQFFDMVEIFYDDDYRPEETNLYIAITAKDFWELYASKAMDLERIDKKCTIYGHAHCHFDGTKYCTGSDIATSTNFTRPKKY